MRGSEWAPLSPATPDREGGLRDKTPRCSLPRGQEAWHQGDCRWVTTTPTHRHKCLGGWEDTPGRSAVWPLSRLATQPAGHGRSIHWAPAPCSALLRQVLLLPPPAGTPSALGPYRNSQLCPTTTVPFPANGGHVLSGAQVTSLEVTLS